MRVGFTLTGFEAIENGLKQVPRDVNEQVMQSSLRDAVKPMAAKMVQEAPKGRGNHRVSLSRTAGRSDSYRKGGATKQDIRIKAVKDKIGEVKVLVGVSKSSGKVGWRTHFIRQGVAGTRRIAPNDFIQRAYLATITLVRTRFIDTLKKKTEAALRRFGM